MSVQKTLPIFFVCSLIGSLSFGAGEKSEERPTPPEITVLAQGAEAGKHKLVIVSEETLYAPAFNPHALNNVPQWYVLKEVAEKDGKHVYETSQTFTFSPSTIFNLSSWTEGSEYQFGAKYVVPADFTTSTKEAKLRLSQTSVVSQDEFDKRLAGKVTVVAGSTSSTSSTTAATPTGNHWLDAVNAFRAQRGLAPFVHNQALYEISVENDRRGGRHNYTGGHIQIWGGYGNIQSDINNWMGRTYLHSHGVHLTGGYREAGVYCGAYGCTITF